MQPIDVDEQFIKGMDFYREPSSPKLLEACSQSVVVFAEKMLGIRPYSWQVHFLHNVQEAIDKRTGEEFVAMTSRQIGKSTAVAILALWACVFNKAPSTINMNTLVGITSATDRQAKKLLREMKLMINRGDTFMTEKYKDNDGKPLFGEKFFSMLISEDDPNNTTTITFKSWRKSIHGDRLLINSLAGSSIKSYAPSPAILGETFTLIIVDEAGRTDEISDEFIQDHLYPTGNRNKAVRIYLSTPWVTSGFFYRLVDPDGLFGENKVRKCVFSIDAIKLEDPDYHKTVMAIVDKMNADGATDEVQRGYFCRFVKGEQSFFDSKKVFDVFKHNIHQLKAYKGSCDMGIDFGGQVTSKTVITISRLNEDGIIERLYHKIYPVGQDLSLLDDVAELMSLFNIMRIIPDDCPAGHFLIRKMQEKGWLIHPMNFRAEKVKKFGAFRSMVNRKQVASYEDEQLRTEMLALEFKHNPKQSVIEHAPGYTDDLIDSFVLSAYFFVTDEIGVKSFDWD